MSNKNYDCSQITQNRKATCSNNNYYYTTNVNGLTNPLNEKLETNNFSISGNTINPSICLSDGQNFQVALCDPQLMMNIDYNGNVDMTGATTVTAPTITDYTDSTTNVATTEFVQGAISAGVTTITPVAITTPQVASNVLCPAGTGFVVKNSSSDESLAIRGDTITAGSLSGNGSISLTGLGTGNVAISSGANGNLNLNGSTINVTPTAGTTNFTGRIDMNYLGGNDKINIGYLTGNSGQGNNAIAIGNSAGNSGQSAGSVAIGASAGQTSQGGLSVAVGSNAGSSVQRDFCVAIGYLAGKYNQQDSSVCIGYNAGTGVIGVTGQNTNSVAIGRDAGATNQKANTVAIGVSAGQFYQGASAVAIGNNAGNGAFGTGQGANAVAIGTNAGNVNQGASSVAIGNLAGNGTCVANSIVLNGSGVALPAPNPALYVAPVRAYSSQTQSGVLQYDSGTKEIFYNTSKTITENVMYFTSSSGGINASPTPYYFGNVADTNMNVTFGTPRTQAYCPFDGMVSTVNLVMFTSTTTSTGTFVLGINRYQPPYTTSSSNSIGSLNFTTPSAHSTFTTFAPFSVSKGDYLEAYCSSSSSLSTLRTTVTMVISSQ